MNFNRRLIYFTFVFMLILANIIGSAITLSGRAHPSLNCFAVDSEGRVYVGTGDTIRVYSDNQYLYTFSDLDIFDEIPMKGTVFTITEEDVLLMSTYVNFYEMDLQGNILNVWPYSEKQVESSKIREQGKLPITRGEDEYSLRNSLGRTSIVKNDIEVVYQISLASLAVKMVSILTIVTFLPMVVIGSKIFLNYWQERH